MNRILVIFNPTANSTKAKNLKKKVESLSHHITVKMTSCAGDAEAMAKHAIKQGFCTVIAAGGDGTINEVVNGLAGSNVTLGILPIGTMNVFASELGLPMHDISKAWDVIENGYCRSIDLPMINNNHFVQLAGAGLDAEVIRRTPVDSKNTLGPMSYLLTLAQVAARKPPRIYIKSAGVPVREGSFVLVGNGRFYGGPFVLFKNAKLDDGLLDVLVFKNQSHWDLMRYFQAIAFGMHPDLPDVEYFQAPSLSLSSKEEVPVEVDGELLGELPVRFRFSKHALKVLVPSETLQNEQK